MATSSTYRDYASSYVGFLNYINFSVHVIEKWKKFQVSPYYPQSSRNGSRRNRNLMGMVERQRRRERYLNRFFFFFQVNIKNFDCSPSTAGAGGKSIAANDIYSVWPSFMCSGTASPSWMLQLVFEHLGTFDFLRVLLTKVLILRDTLNIPHYNCLLKKRNIS